MGGIFYVSHLGKKQGPHTAEHRAKISAANLGKKMSKATRVKMSLAAQQRTSEHLAKISAALKGRPLPEWHRLKLSKAHKGKIPSKATRAKMKASQRARRANTTVSAITRARAAASMKEWHRQAGHKIS